MKKYVKPMMESEAFIANEYIGACWSVSCDNGQSLIISGEKGQTLEQALYYYNDLELIGFDSTANTYIIQGQIGDCSGQYINGNCNHTKIHVDLDCETWGDWIAVGFCEYVATPIVQGYVDRYRQDKTGKHHHAQITPKGKSDGPNAS